MVISLSAQEIRYDQSFEMLSALMYIDLKVTSLYNSLDLLDFAR